MVKFLGLITYLIDRLYDKVSEVAWDLELRRRDREDAKRHAWLLTLDPEQVRKEGDLGSIILAKQAEVAQSRMQEGMVRKGGINRGPSKVVTRPPPPAPMSRNAQ